MPLGSFLSPPYCQAAILLALSRKIYVEATQVEARSPKGEHALVFELSSERQCAGRETWTWGLNLKPESQSLFEGCHLEKGLWLDVEPWSLATGCRHIRRFEQTSLP
jgi:hypothetical protein